MLGVELCPNIDRMPGDPAKAQSVRMVMLLQDAGLLTIPAGTQVIRLLPPLNLHQEQAREGLQIIETVMAAIAANRTSASAAV